MLLMHLRWTDRPFFTFLTWFVRLFILETNMHFTALLLVLCSFNIYAVVFDRMLALFWVYFIRISLFMPVMVLTCLPIFSLTCAFVRKCNVLLFLMFFLFVFLAQPSDELLLENSSSPGELHLLRVDGWYAVSYNMSQYYMHWWLICCGLADWSLWSRCHLCFKFVTAISSRVTDTSLSPHVGCPVSPVIPKFFSYLYVSALGTKATRFPLFKRSFILFVLF